MSQIISHLLATWVLKLRTTQSLYNLRLVAIARADGHDWLSDANASNGSLWFTESTTHSCLEPEKSDVVIISREFLVIIDASLWIR